MHINKHNMDIGRERGRGERDAFALLRSQKLSGEEKYLMRQTLKRSMNQSRVIAPSGYRGMSFFSIFFGRSFVVSTLIIVLVLGSGLGVARASEQALPGDALYPVKTQFNEPLIGSFKLSEEARVAWEHERAKRRIAEAETLAEEGRLGDSEKSEIEQQLFNNWKKTEDIENRTISDTEFFSDQDQNEDPGKDTRVRTEYRDEKVHIYVEKRETKSDNQQGSEQSDQWVNQEEDHQSDVQGDSGEQKNNPSFENQKSGEKNSKKSGGSDTRLKGEGDAKTTSDQKVQEKSTTKDSSSGDSGSSSDGKQENGSSGDSGSSDGGDSNGGSGDGESGDSAQNSGSVHV